MQHKSWRGMSRLGFGSNNTPDPGFVGENKRGNRQTRAYSWARMSTKASVRFSLIDMHEVAWVAAALFGRSPLLTLEDELIDLLCDRLPLFSLQSLHSACRVLHRHAQRMRNASVSPSVSEWPARIFYPSPYWHAGRCSGMCYAS